MSLKSMGNRLIVVSNRLPFVLSRGRDGHWKVEPGSGGLVTALLPVLRNRGGLWFGWTGTVGQEDADLEATLSQMTRGSGYTLKPILLTSEEREKFYHGFSNEVIWPLFHDLETNCNFDPAFWRVYQQVNRKFAVTILAEALQDDFIWVHDYHLMEVARELRRLGNRSKLGFFLHIPFPSPDIFLKLPWRFEILRSLLHYDIIGFQTLRDRRNFIQCARTLLKNVAVQGKGQVLSMQIDGAALSNGQGHGKAQKREIRIGAFPISIDYGFYADQSGSAEVDRLACHFRDNLHGRQMILGVDRLDYTKGIPNRLEAFRNALSRFPELKQKITFIQHVVPSREDISKYHNLRLEIEHLVSEINGEFTESGWVPIHYFFRSLKPIELLAYYRAAEIALITPLKDGMNLVAKEYCAAQVEEKGVLILSEFAGAAAQLQKAALLVNPHDIEGVAHRIYEAFHMSPEERKFRMRRLRRSIRDSHIFWWVDSFLRAAIEKDLSDFPVLEEYIPDTETAMHH